MENFKKISPEALENAIKLIGKDWMLITVRDSAQGKVNAMTASWGAMGVLWNKNVCICFVRPQRYTHELLEEEGELSIAILGEEHRDALKLCGRVSGRDTDKLSECGLDTVDCNGVPVIAQARVALVCKKLYVDELKQAAFLDESLLSNYAAGDYHTVYICEIKEAFIKED